jgi:ArsR family transcriptional regulator
MSRCRYLSLDVGRSGESESESGSEESEGLDSLATELDRLENLENELSMAQRWVQGRLTDVMDRLSEEFDARGGLDGRFYAEVLSAMANGADTVPKLSRRVDAAPEMVEEALSVLARYDVVSHDDDRWQITEA